MAHEQLAEYIKKAMEHGQNNDQIRSALIGSGWNAVDVDAALAVGTGAPVPPTPPPAAAQTNSDLLPSAIEMWKRSWAIFRKRMGTFLAISTVSAIAYVVYFVFFNNSDTLSLFFGLVLYPLIQVPVGLAFMFAVQGGDQVGFGKAFGLAFGKFFRAVWLSIINLFIVSCAMGLFFIPGIILLGWFLFAMYVLAFENQGGMNALFYSREYVRGRWWIAVGFTFLPAFIAGLVAFAIYGIFFLLNVAYAEYIASAVVNLFLLPISSIYMYLVYAGFKATKGQIVVKTNIGRKAKYIILALASLIVPMLFFGGSIIAMMYAL